MVVKISIATQLQSYVYLLMHAVYYGVTTLLNWYPIGRLGNWCLNGWQGAWAPQAIRQGGIHGNLSSGNHPFRQLPTGSATLKPDQWKNTHLTPILTKKVWNFWQERRAGSLIGSHTGKLIHNNQLETMKICKKHLLIMIIDLQCTAWICKDLLKTCRSKLILKDRLELICKDPLKHQLFDLQRSAWICKDSLTHWQSATPAKGSRQTLVTTLYHVTCSLGVIHWPQWDTNPQQALARS